MNKKLVALILGTIFIFSAVPTTVEGQTSEDEPWIKVYEGNMAVDESLTLGNYKVKISESETNGEPHVIISKNGNVVEIEQVYFGREIESNGLKVIPGKETDDDDILIIVKHKSKLANELSVEEDESYEVKDHTIETKDISNKELNVTIDDSEYSIEENSIIYHDNLGLKYENNLYVYNSEIEPKLDNSGGGIEIDLSAIGLEAKAGQKIEFPVEMTSNTSDEIAELNVLDKPDDWEAYFQYNEQRVRLLSLKEDDPKPVNLEVEPPRDAPLGEHNIQFGVNGKVRDVSVFIHETFRGELAEITLNVEDDSGPVNNAEVVIGNETFITNSEGSVEIEKEPGDYNMKIRKEGYKTSSKDVELLDGEEKSEDERIERSSYHFDAGIESSSLRVRFDNQQPYEITIDNKGRLNDEYNLKLKGLPSDWTHSFFKSSEQSVRTSTVEIDSEESNSVYLKTIPTYNSKPKEYNATLVIEGSGQKYEKNLTIELIGNYQLDVNFGNYQVSGKAGDTVTTELNIRNYGSAPISNINFEVQGPDGWSTTVEPQRITNLDRRERRTATLEIQIPEGTSSGEQMIEVKTKSDQEETSSQLRVQVSQSSNTALIGIGILAIAIGGVVVMMKRVGRK